MMSLPVRRVSSAPAGRVYSVRIGRGCRIDHQFRYATVWYGPINETGVWDLEECRIISLSGKIRYAHMWNDAIIIPSKGRWAIT